MVLIKSEENTDKVQLEDKIEVKPVIEDPASIPASPKNVLYEVKESPNKVGMGMYAKEDLQPGQVILREKPLIVMPDKIFSDEDVDKIERWLEKRVNRLSSEDREIYFNLADSRSDGEKTSLGLF